MTDYRRARTAFLWVGVIVPLALLTIAAALIWTWLPELPEPVAIHWGTDGANGYGPGWTYLALTLGVGGGLVVLFTAMALLAHRMPQGPPTSPTAQAPAPRWSPTARLLGAISLGTSSMIALLMVVSVNVQRGLADAADAPDTTSWLFVGFGTLVVLAALGWFLQPRPGTSPDAGQQAASGIRLAPGERAAWFGSVAIGRTGVIILVVAMLLLIGATILVFAVEAGTVGWIMVVVTVLVLGLIATTLVFRVRVNSAGLLVRSVLGWPRWSIRTSEIVDVRVVQVNPVAEFGGWGLRIGADGRMGVVLRTGEALQVTRENGRAFVVTIDDAATAAAVLTATVKETS
jgi:hypothetical protein